MNHSDKVEFVLSPAGTTEAYPAAAGVLLLIPLWYVVHCPTCGENPDRFVLQSFPRQAQD